MNEHNEQTRTLPIPGVTLTTRPEWLWLRSERELALLSSGPGGDGVRTGQHIVSMYVAKDYCSSVPERDLAGLAARLGIAPSAGWVGLMTGVALDGAVVAIQSSAGLTVATVATVGLGNVSAAGRDPTGGALHQPAAPPAGTINIVVVLSQPLTLAGMVNAVVTATEAKVLSLMSAGVRTPAGEPASGTSSDAIIIAAPALDGTTEPLRYAGTATLAGLLIGATVRQAIASRLPRAGL